MKVERIPWDNEVRSPLPDFYAHRWHMSQRQHLVNSRTQNCGTTETVPVPRNEKRVEAGKLSGEEGSVS